MNKVKKRVFEEIECLVGMVLDSEMRDFEDIKDEFNKIIEGDCDDNFGIGMITRCIDTDGCFFDHVCEQVEGFDEYEWNDFEYDYFCEKTLEYIFNINTDIVEFEKEVEEWKDQFMKSHVNNIIEKYYDVYNYNVDEDSYMKYMLKSLDIKSTKSDIIMKYYKYFLNKLEEKNGKEMIPQNVREYVSEVMEMDVEWVRPSDVEKVLLEDVKDIVKNKNTCRIVIGEVESFDDYIDDEVYWGYDVTFRNLMDCCDLTLEDVNNYVKEIRNEK